MYKRIIVLGLIFLWVFFGMLIDHSYAQTYTQDDLKNIEVRFCDKVWDMTFKKTINVEPWKEGEVSFCIYNNAERKIPVTYWFTTAIYNWVWTRVCEETTDTKNHDFTLIPIRGDRTVVMEPLQAQMIKEKIVIPPGITTGIQLWCLVAEIWWGEKIDMGWMFFLKVRKAFDLNVVVWGVEAIKNSIKVLDMTWWSYTTNPKVKATVDEENNLIVWFLIENNGNVSQKLTITGKIYNALGFEKEFVANKTVSPTSIDEITANIGILPAYKWLFSIKFNIQNEPQFDFDVSNIENQEWKTVWYMTEKANVFIFSRIRVIAIIIVLLIIYRFFVPKKAKTLPVQQVQFIPPSTVPPTV